MTAGVSKWSTAGKEPKRMEFKPFAAGDYELQLDTSGATIAKSEREGAVPYVKFKVKVPAVQTGSGQPRTVFCMAHLGLTPGSDGLVMPERANGILGLVKSLGEDAEFSELNDDAGHRLSAKEVKQWLIDHDGAMLKGHVKVKKGTGGYSDSNEVAYWISADEAEADEADDEGSDGAGEADSESSDEGEDEVLKKAAKPATKAAKPAPRAAKKR